MAARRTQNPLFRKGACFHVKRIISIAAALLLIFTVSTGFSAGPAHSQGAADTLINDPVYLIPDQSPSPFALGLAITPDQINGFVDQAAYPFQMNPSDDDYFMTRHADVSTVVRVALSEFDCLSGLNLLVEDAEKTVNLCTRKLMLTGQINLHPRNMTPTAYIERVNLVAHIYQHRQKAAPSHQRYFIRILRQLEMDKLTWNTGFRISHPGISFKLGIGDAFMIYSTAGEDSNIGVVIKLSI